jgi:hypothetical protein
MKRSFFLIVIISLIVSCNTKKPGEDRSQTDTSIVSHIDTAKITTDNNANITTDTHYFWSSEWSTKKGLVMKKTSQISEDSLTPSRLIQKLNKLYPEIRLRFIKISNDSIFVAIKKSKYLTQQMGSSGAEAYLAEVTYNLTELKDINFVDMRFKAGDHASPSTYARTDFIEVNN